MSAQDSDTTAPPNDPASRGREAMARELYWAEQQAPPDDASATELAASWSDLAERLRMQEQAGLAHPTLGTGSRPRRALKRRLFRLFRPLTRRSPEVARELGLRLQDGGWRLRGVDISAQAVDACQAAGVDALQGDAVSCLAAYEGEPPAAISGLQLIEHLPREVWLPLIRAAYGALQPDG